MKNNKNLFIKNIIIVILGVFFFLIIIKFFPVTSGPNYQNVKEEEIADNFKAEALKYEGETIDEINPEIKLTEEEQKIADEKAATESSKEDPKSNIENTESVKVVPVDISTRTDTPVFKGGSSQTTSSNSAPPTTPEPNIIPTPATTSEPNINPEPIIDMNLNLNDSNLEDSTNLIEEVDTIDSILVTTTDENEDSHSNINNNVTTGSIPVVLLNQQISEKINNIVETLPVSTQEKIIKAGEKVTAVTVKTAEAVSSPVGQVVSTTVTSAGAVAGASMSASAVLSINTLMVSDFFLGIIRLWGIILTALGLRKRNKPWGSVYDSVTKQPLDPVYVSLENLEGKEIASAITDLDGRYGFLAQAGKYKLNAHKANYEFPSQKARGKEIDQIYSDLYFGETIEISTSGEVLTKNIPMDAIKFDWNEFEKNRRNLMKFYSRKNILFLKVADILFNLGLLITVVATITVPGIYNTIILIIYIILYILRKLVIKPKSYGSIIEKEGGAPLSFGIIHVKKSSNEIIHKVADKIGRFYCLIPNGVYDISIDKKISDEDYIEVYKEEGYEVKNGYINKKFQV